MQRLTNNSRPAKVSVRPLKGLSSWTDTDIDHLAEISQADIIQAVELWRANVPPTLASLLDAEVIEHDGSTPS